MSLIDLKTPRSGGSKTRLGADYIQLHALRTHSRTRAEHSNVTGVSFQLYSKHPSSGSDKLPQVFHKEQVALLITLMHTEDELNLDYR